VACLIMEGLPLANALTLGHGAVASITSSIPGKLRDINVPPVGQDGMRTAPDMDLPNP
jgi:hypothetical protein